jgi:hypothetical protein
MVFSKDQRYCEAKISKDYKMACQRQASRHRVCVFIRITQINLVFKCDLTL